MCSLHSYRSCEENKMEHFSQMTSMKLMRKYSSRDLFILLTGNAGKEYIKEVTGFLNTWAQDTPMRSIKLKAIQAMHALLLQNPSKTSKSRDHLDALERRQQF